MTVAATRGDIHAAAHRQADGGDDPDTGGSGEAAHDSAVALEDDHARSKKPDAADDLRGNTRRDRARPGSSASLRSRRPTQS